MVGNEWMVRYEDISVTQLFFREIELQMKNNCLNHNALIDVIEHVTLLRRSKEERAAPVVLEIVSRNPLKGFSTCF